MPLPLGTKQSIGFLQSIILCKNEEIFRSHLLRGIIEFKWRRAYYIIFIQALFYLVFITLQLLLIFKTSINPWIWGALFIINVLFTIKEILLVKNAGKYYLKVLWNFLELFKIVLVYIYLGYAVFSNDEETRDEILLPFSIVITWIRGFGYLRLFKNTRYLMRLILEVIKDMGPFVVILLSSVLTFGVIFYDVRIADTFKIDLLKSYALSYGEFNLGDRYTGYQNSMFVIASLLNTLVLLSLIISLMGDTYDKVISIMEIAELKEFASLIMETETLLF